MSSVRAIGPLGHLEAKLTPKETTTARKIGHLHGGICIILILMSAWQPLQVPASIHQDPHIIYDIRQRDYTIKYRYTLKYSLNHLSEE